MGSKVKQAYKDIIRKETADDIETKKIIKEM